MPCAGERRGQASSHEPGPPGNENFHPLFLSCYGISPNPAAPEPKKARCGMDEFPANPPNPPLSKGGQGGFPKLGANLRTFQQISNALEDDIFTQVHFRVIQVVLATPFCHPRLFWRTSDALFYP